MCSITSRDTNNLAEFDDSDARMRRRQRFILSAARKEYGSFHFDIRGRWIIGKLLAQGSSYPFIYYIYTHYRISTRW